MLVRKELGKWVGTWPGGTGDLEGSLGFQGQGGPTPYGVQAGLPGRPFAGTAPEASPGLPACLQSGHPRVSPPSRAGSKEGLPQCAKCPLCACLLLGNCHLCSPHRPSWFKIKASVRPLGRPIRGAAQGQGGLRRPRQLLPQGPPACSLRPGSSSLGLGGAGQDCGKHGPPRSEPWGCPASGCLSVRQLPPAGWLHCQPNVPDT